MSQRLYFGLNVNRSLNEISDKTEALKNLNLNIDDLNVFRGMSKNIGKNHIKAISNLDVDAKKEYTRIERGMEESFEALSDATDYIGSLNTNVYLDGQLTGSAIKYNYVDFSSNSEIKTADISSSRVSSWSSFDASVNANSEIFYGGDLEVVKLGNNSIIECTDIDLSQKPIERQFAAELPTHLITITINNQEKQFYAMQGIPLQFSGFSRNVVFSYKVNEFENVKPTIVFFDKAAGIEEINEDVSLTGTLSFFDSKSSNKTVNLYYLPKNIEEIQLTSFNLNSLPIAKLENLAVLNLAGNDFRSVPDLTTFSPNLKELNLNANDLSRSTNDANTQLSISNLPTSIEILRISKTFKGQQEDIDLTFLNNLKELDFSALFGFPGPERNINSQTSPAVNSSVIEIYDVNRQRFESLDISVQNATNLKTLRIDGTTISDNNISIDSSEIQTIIAGQFGATHNIIDVSGKQKLVDYRDTRRDIVNGNKTLNFAGCEKLERIDFFGNRQAKGDLRNLLQNLPKLNFVSFFLTSVYGKIANDSFSGSNLIRDLYLQSDDLGKDINQNPISEDFFDENSIKNLEFLENLRVSRGNVNGTLPNFDNNVNIKSLTITRTNISGGLTNFVNANNILKINLNNNSINQTLPKFEKDSLRTLNVLNNQFFGSVPLLIARNLNYLNLANNNFSGSLPDLSNCPRIVNAILDRNNFDSYASGSFSNLLSIERLFLNANNLTISSIENIINDLIENYNNNARGGVSVDLRLNGVSLQDLNSTAQSQKIFLENNGWSILI